MDFLFFGVSIQQSVHVAISLLAIVLGFWVMAAMIGSRRAPGATLAFLVLTLATTLSGFLLPLNGITPAVATGFVSLVVLAAAFWARYGGRMRGRWRGVWVVSALVALWLNVFVLVTQLFLKAPALNALAPNGTEPPFLIAQVATLVLFVWAGVVAWRRFRP